MCRDVPGAEEPDTGEGGKTPWQREVARFGTRRGCIPPESGCGESGRLPYRPRFSAHWAGVMAQRKPVFTRLVSGVLFMRALGR